MFKICTRCGISKSLDEFNFRNKSKNLKYRYCKECSKALSKQSYYNQSAERRCSHLQSIRKRNKQTKVMVRLEILEFLKTHPCVDCGETDVDILEFDHVRGDKKFNIGTFIATVHSRARNRNAVLLTEEIAKCEVRCANCHRKRHANERRNPCKLY